MRVNTGEPVAGDWRGGCCVLEKLNPFTAKWKVWGWQWGGAGTREGQPPGGIPTGGGGACSTELRVESKVLLRVGCRNERSRHVRSLTSSVRLLMVNAAMRAGGCDHSVRWLKLKLE